MDRQYLERIAELRKVGQLGGDIDDLYAAPNSSILPTLKRVHNIGKMKGSSWGSIGPSGQREGRALPYQRVPWEKKAGARELYNAGYVAATRLAHNPAVYSAAKGMTSGAIKGDPVRALSGIAGGVAQSRTGSRVLRALKDKGKKVLESSREALYPSPGRVVLASVKTAEPPPPPGVSLEQWDKILARKTKSKEMAKSARKMCFDESVRMAVKDPSLTLMKGEPFKGSGDSAHFWLEDKGGKIVDPTAYQYPASTVSYVGGRPVSLSRNREAVARVLEKKAYEVQDYRHDPVTGKITSHFYGNRLGTMSIARSAGLEPKAEPGVVGYTASREVTDPKRLEEARGILKDRYARSMKRSSGIFGTPIMSGRDRQRYVKAKRGLASLGEATEKKAYKLQGHDNVQGLRIAIENRKGSVRKGKDSDGKEWRTKMVHPYGYLVGTEAKDGEPVDVYVGPDKEAPHAFVVHQHNDDGKGFDEDKVMLGFKSKREAKTAYLKHYNDPKFLGPVSKVSVDRLRALVKLKKRLVKIT